MTAVDPHPATVQPPRPRRGRPPSLSRDVVAAAALEVGFAQLTVKAVAERLGVTHAALYTHVTDRDDLVIAAADLACRHMPPPSPTTGWRDDLETEAWHLWETFEANPGMVTAVHATGRAPAAVRERFAATCQRMVGHGFTPELAVLAADTVIDLAADSSARGSELEQQASADRSTIASAWAEPLDPALAAVLRDAVLGPPRQWFARKLALVLDGIAAAAGRS